MKFDEYVQYSMGVEMGIGSIQGLRHPECSASILKSSSESRLSLCQNFLFGPFVTFCVKCCSPKQGAIIVPRYNTVQPNLTCKRFDKEDRRRLHDCVTECKGSMQLCNIYLRPKKASIQLFAAQACTLKP